MAQLHSEAAKVIDQMHVLMAKFERNQNLEDYEQVKALHQDLISKYEMNPSQIDAKFDVASIFKSGFGEFPQIAQNDYAIDQI